jgi:hypothetical protein
MAAVVVQWLVVAALVAGCAVYAAWTLLPAAARRRVATVGVDRHWPFEPFWRRHAQAVSGCGCDGCDAAPLSNRAKGDATRPSNSSGTTEARPITFHPRR